MPSIKILLIGRQPPTHLLDKIDWVPAIKFDEYLEVIAQAKIVLITSISDASPRILTQALYMNTSVIVNTNIVGGFKYANPMTGSLFINEEDIV